MSDFKVIKNIVFDLGGVILKRNPVSILDKFDVCDEDYKELTRFFSDGKRLDLGEQTLQEKFIECNFSNDISLKYKDILLNYYEYRDFNLELAELVKKLKNNNYKLYVLSDNSLEATAYYFKNPLFTYFDGCIVSCHYGVMKWSGELFEILFDGYNLVPRESYFVDDNPANIDIAHKYGMKWYIFNENENIANLHDDMRSNWIEI